jgi:DNA-binding protein Fis
MHKNGRLQSGSEGVRQEDGTSLLKFIREQLEAGEDNLHSLTIQHAERILLSVVLQKTGGNKLRAANILGITRGSLRHKMNELGIIIDRCVVVRASDSGPAPTST